MGKPGAKKVGRNDGPQRAGGQRTKAGSGEGADSALANLRELERTRSQCEPADDVVPEPPPRPVATRPPAREGRDDIRAAGV